MLAQRGAGKISSLDISPEWSRWPAGGGSQRASAGVEFVVGSAHDLPLPDESVDVVFGIAILHHLDLKLAAREVRRVLRPGGRAIFEEPVRNSPLLKFVRRLIPYRSPDVSPYERPLTDAEMDEFASGFSSTRSQAFTLPTTAVASLVPPLRRFVPASTAAAAHPPFPALAYYASLARREMTK